MAPKVSSRLIESFHILSANTAEKLTISGIGTITSSGSWTDSPGNAADLTVNSYFCSKDAPNQWLCHDFGDHRISLTHYSIRYRHRQSLFEVMDD
jgi:hypothetical protein